MSVHSANYRPTGKNRASVSLDGLFLGDTELGQPLVEWSLPARAPNGGIVREPANYVSCPYLIADGRVCTVPFEAW